MNQQICPNYNACTEPKVYRCNSNTHIHCDTYLQFKKALRKLLETPVGEVRRKLDELASEDVGEMFIGSLRRNVE